MPSYIRFFLGYNVFFTSVLGVSLIGIFDLSHDRLIDISNETKDRVFWHVIYSFVVVSSFLYLISRVVPFKEVAGLDQYVFDRFDYRAPLFFLLALNSIYVAALVLLFSDSIPLFVLFDAGNLDYALQVARLQHEGGFGYNIPYISKFFEYLNIFLPVFSLLLFLRKDVGFFVVLLAYFSSLLFLSFDLQKAPFLLVCLLSVYVVYLVSGSFLKFAYRSFGVIVVVLVALYLYSFFMGKGFLEMFLYILDRPVFGQVQGIYYMYEYYPVSMDAAFSKFYFSTGYNEMAPDIYIADIIYPGVEHIVNVNAYFIGEAWSFAGLPGVLISPWLICLSLMIYMFLSRYVIGYRFAMGYVMVIIFFATLPVNQSLQFVIYQKYFAYYLVFFVIPMLLVFKLFRSKSR